MAKPVYHKPGSKAAASSREVIAKDTTARKVSHGPTKSAVKDVPTKVLENELKRRNRLEMGPKKAPRWTPAGQAAHKSRGGPK